MKYSNFGKDLDTNISSIFSMFGGNNLILARINRPIFPPFLAYLDEIILIFGKDQETNTAMELVF